MFKSAMRRTVLTLMVAVALLAPAAAHGATKHHKRPLTCPPPHADILLRDRTAVVFQLENLATDFFRKAVCSTASTKPYVLVECESLDCEGPSVADETLAGNILAYARYEYSGSFKYMTAAPSSQLIQVRDLRTHRLIHSSPTSTSPPPPLDVIGNGGADGIVVKSDGSVAWIAVDGAHPYLPSLPTTYQVWKIDQSGQHLLAMGTQIVPNSIALAGSTVYWTDGGVPSSAPLD
jgi:hypothetical protein